MPSPAALGPYQSALLAAVIAAGPKGAPVKVPGAGLKSHQRTKAIATLSERGFFRVVAKGAGRRPARVIWTGKEEGDGLTDFQRVVLALIEVAADSGARAPGSSALARHLALNEATSVAAAIGHLERKKKIRVTYEERRVVYEIVATGARTLPGPIGLSAPRTQRCLTPLTKPMPVPAEMDWPFRHHPSQAEFASAASAKEIPA